MKFRKLRWFWEDLKNCFSDEFNQKMDDATYGESQKND